MTYLELKQKHQDAVDSFPMFFAFNNAQFKEGMGKLGLEEAETSKLLSIGAGGFIRKADLPNFEAMLEQHKREESEARLNYDYLVQMFSYELSNHEYCYTGDTSETLDSLGLTVEDINGNQLMGMALHEAIKQCSTE